MTPDWVVIVALIVMAFFVIRGAFRGFAGELAPLIALAATVAGLWYGYPHIRSLFADYGSAWDATAQVFYAAATTAILAFILYFSVKKLTRNLFSWMLPQPFNAILGLLIGGAKGFILISIVAGVCSVANEQLQALREQPAKHKVIQSGADIWKNHFLKNETLQNAAIDTLSNAIKPTEKQP